MPIGPVSRTALSDAVYAQLVEEILAGRFVADDALPAERDLAESFQVSRHVVREALKRLQQSGLVQITQGGATRVLDWRTSAGLDVLVDIARIAPVHPVQILRDMVRMRRSIGADAARLCAETGTDAAIERIGELARSYPPPDSDPVVLVVANLRFWTAVVDGSANIAYRLGLNTLVAAIDAIGPETIAGLLDEYADGDALVVLAGHLAHRDADRAHEMATDLLGGVVDRLDRLVATK
ncbi:GntR family transcriptional regulator [Aldersonia sp. NBC_00410]|uniref:FadR/GntR family transcriptional regulator n=1 Tax=Aldersonia sp. NBC_00410 TaxID=2975954 RepID=UPI002253B412|nr:GntR family transcriptional regulator [Aldersonia sp. NBC_00410]MCX5045851.1 GntR family transcriptional regulator [Aldersonia sp. NBC_00410]